MIHYVLNFSDELTAQVDKITSSYYINLSWRGDICIPGQQVIQRSTGKVLSGWCLGISLDTPNDALLNHANLIAAFDRDAAMDGGKFLLFSTYKSEDFADLMFSAFMGDQTIKRMEEAKNKITIKDKQDWVSSVAKNNDVIGTKALDVTANVKAEVIK